ncbi:hypothetical protein OS493_017035 [Desmophyllum pertusum]|uniref:Uncharacterized protein n=1 Tax=Desmophyllum pertusum TaxID=174260 RepID=A0A9W9YNW2_9CNID|nr:hypothetical protein OS493_017035 [Desmophyllum pertusum]
MSGKTEEQALAEFLEMVNEIASSKSAEARAEFKQWKSEISDHSNRIRLNWKLEDEKIPHLKSKELPKDQYSCLLDPHAWATNNYVCGIGGTLLIGGTIAVAAVSGLGT